MTRYLSILREQSHPLKFLISRLLMRTGLSRFFSIPQSGFHLRFFPTSLSASLWINPEDRKDDVAFFREFLRPGDSVVDVGANIGSLSILAAITAGNTGKVIAIEPHPRIYGFQRQNLAFNQIRNVESHNVALGESPGQLHFSDERSDDQNGVLSDGGIVVTVTTLDTLTVALPAIALLKIDVEGYELPVLKGARETLARTACVYFESWETHLQKWNVTTGDVIHFLQQSGFQVYKGIKQRRIQRVLPDYISSECEDLIAVRNPDVLLGRMACVVE